ncbi:uncharacterized protein LOC132060935 isoform X2 [Lycium ferocissimum]|uniref:uncharacterized protein LOC132060935 isoform X2 n=1 Tax=Lycium ferocissimum TaxID=112874 RepID=UPI0028169991|nr:uncharacterized protein LOC132060935 isoform X2 [Lycium ferocissimum]
MWRQPPKLRMSNSERSAACDYYDRSHLVHERQAGNPFFFDSSYEQSYIVSRCDDSYGYDCNPEYNQYPSFVWNQTNENQPPREENMNLKESVLSSIKNLDEKFARNLTTIRNLTLQVNHLASMLISLNYGGENLNETTSCENEPSQENEHYVNESTT